MINASELNVFRENPRQCQHRKPNPAFARSSPRAFEGGILDSTGVLEVVAFLEDELDVKVSDEEMIPENFASIARITAFVDRKRHAMA